MHRLARGATTATEWVGVMQANKVPEVKRAGAAKAEWTSGGWIDSSWELAHGLVVVEDLPAELWQEDPNPVAEAKAADAPPHEPR